MSQRPMHSPLTDDHLRQINNMMPHLEKTAAQIALAKRAGLNMDQQEAEHKKQLDTLTRIKQVYFPGE